MVNADEAGYVKTTGDIQRAQHASHHGLLLYTEWKTVWLLQEILSSPIVTHCEAIPLLETHPHGLVQVLGTKPGSSARAVSVLQPVLWTVFSAP